ncbi:TPA: hypothetical protein ACXE54_001526 [Klebsiella michiganensis]
MDRRSFLTNAIVTAGCVSFAPSSISQTSNISQCQRGLYLADYLEKYSNITDAVQLAFDDAVKDNKALYLGDGIFKLERTIVVKGGLTLIGNGIGCTSFVFPQGLNGFIFNLTDDKPILSMSSFNILTSGFGGTGITLNGSALIDNTGKIKKRTQLKGIFRDLNISGIASNSAWNCGIQLNSIGWTNFDNIVITGIREGHTPLGTGIWISGQGWPVEYYIDKIRIYNVAYGIIGNDYCEGIFITNFNLVNVVYGVFFSRRGLKLPIAGKKSGVFQLILTNGHINAIRNAVTLSNNSYTTVNNVFIILDDKGVVEENNAVFIENTNYINLYDLKIGIWRTNKIMNCIPIILKKVTNSIFSSIIVSTKGFELDFAVSSYKLKNVQFERVVFDGVKRLND